MPYERPPAGGEIVDNLNAGWKRRVLRELVEVDTAAASKSLRQKLPPHSRVRAVQLNFDTAITLAGGTAPVKVGLGTSGDPDALALSGTTMTKNTHTGPASPLGTTLDMAASETTLQVAACNTSGAADGTMAGSVAVEIVFDQFVQIPDAS